MKDKREIERLRPARPCRLCGRAATFTLDKKPTCRFCIREAKA